MGGWAGLAGAGLLVFAARGREIHLHAGDVPFLDQWKIEGAEILQRWLAGTLSLADFFRPHHEHLPVWTRLLAWLEVLITGQWDPRVQMAVNALLPAGFVVLVLAWTGAGRRAWLGPLVVATAGSALLLGLGSRAGAGPIADLHVQSFPRFLYAWFVQLGWPAGTVLINVPLFVLALQSRGRRDATAFDRIVLALGLWAVLQGAAIGVTAGLAGRWGQATATPPMPPRPDRWRLPLLVPLAGVAWAGLLLWPHPFIFGESRRKAVILRASGTIVPLEYQFLAPATYPLNRIIGAARVNPGELRNIFRGTHLAGPADQVQLQSEPFVLVTPCLIVPFAGHPIHVYACSDPDPTDVGFWEIDTSADQGRQARIVLIDQSADPLGWIAAASPQYAWKPGQGEARTRAWAQEETAPGR